MVGLGACLAAGAWPSATQAVLPPGEPVAWPTVRLLDGSHWSAREVQGQAVVVVFFSLSCGYCRRHNPRVQKLAEQMQGRPLRVLGAVHDGTPAQIRAHLAAEGLGFAITQDAAALHAVLSPRRITPLTCVLDRAGRLREVIPGEMSPDDVMGLARWAESV